MTKEKRIVLQNIHKDENLSVIQEIYQSNCHLFGLKNIDEARVIEDIESIPEGLDINYKEYLKICDGETTVGIVDLLESHPDLDTITLELLLIHQDYQGQGYGTAAYKEVEAYYGQRFLKLEVHVCASDIKGIQFWEKQGLHQGPQIERLFCGELCQVIKMEKDFL